MQNTHSEPLCFPIDGLSLRFYLPFHTKREIRRERSEILYPVHNFDISFWKLPHAYWVPQARDSKGRHASILLSLENMMASESIAPL
ncbi:hypothetical protein HMPREF2617_04905 [Corynebacterium sp. HMSC070H05]|nr:hypothetical protein HMPREF2617_04905 [Corynebacterium sp. HMSC070H05]